MSAYTTERRFIGGPADGDSIHMRGAPTIWMFPVSPSNPLYYRAETFSEDRRPKRAIYRRLEDGCYHYEGIE